MTPQQSGAATTSASVIGTPCVVATSLLLAKPMEDKSADVFLPSARCARAPQILQLSGMRPSRPEWG